MADAVHDASQEPDAAATSDPSPRDTTSCGISQNDPSLLGVKSCRISQDPSLLGAASGRLPRQLFSVKSARRTSGPKTRMRRTSFVTEAVHSDSATAHFSRQLGTALRSSQKTMLILLVVALGIHLAYLARMYDVQPNWRALVPCTFQTSDIVSDLDRVMLATKFGGEVCDVFPILILLVVIGRSAAAGTLHVPSLFPIRAVVLAWLWRTLVVLVMYTIVNVRQITDYASITRKSCEVTLSLFYYPTGRGDHKSQLQELLNYGPLRNATARYFANELNYMAPQYPGLEAHLNGIDELPVRMTVTAVPVTVIYETVVTIDELPVQITASLTLAHRTSHDRELPPSVVSALGALRSCAQVDSALDDLVQCDTSQPQSSGGIYEQLYKCSHGRVGTCDFQIELNR